MRRETFLQINPTRCTILLSIFISLHYMLRATTCLSSGEITVSMRHWYLSLCMGGFWSAGWSETPTSRPDTTHAEWHIPTSHRYSNFSWWWAHICPKHVEKRNKYTKQNSEPSWVYLQDCTRMHGQQNINCVGKLSFVVGFWGFRNNDRLNSFLWHVMLRHRLIGSWRCEGSSVLYIRGSGYPRRLISC